MISLLLYLRLLCMPLFDRFVLVTRNVIFMITDEIHALIFGRVS
jgi:hypothetical protein